MPSLLTCFKLFQKSYDFLLWHTKWEILNNDTVTVLLKECKSNINQCKKVTYESDTAANKSLTNLSWIKQGEPALTSNQ